MDGRINYFLFQTLMIHKYMYIPKNNLVINLYQFIHDCDFSINPKQTTLGIKKVIN